MGIVQGDMERWVLKGDCEIYPENDNYISNVDELTNLNKNKSGSVGKIQENLGSGSNENLLWREPVLRGKSGLATCAWLRSQIIGNGSVIETPFGERQLTYADHTASGRSLRHIENFILQDVLPFYGETIFL
eukprot:c47508_g1_i1 orf=450-845(+)